VTDYGDSALIPYLKPAPTTTFAAFFPHRPHLSRRLAASRLPAPQARTSSTPLKVRAAPQSPHSIFTEQPKRTTSDAVWTCLVDISRR
jgi:hypothetical protein